MANDAAWQMGWDLGAGKKRDTAKPKLGADDTEDSAGTGGQKWFHRKARGGKGGSGGATGGGGAQDTISNLVGGKLFSSAIPSKKKGGPIRKTGVYLLHKNEYVVPASKRGGHKTANRKKVITKA